MENKKYGKSKKYEIIIIKFKVKPTLKSKIFNPNTKILLNIKKNNILI